MGGLWGALADPWSQTIFQRAVAEVALLGLVGGLLGCWLVFYELSYGAESMAHALFPGLVVAALTGLPLLLGGAIGLGVAGLGVAAVGRLPEIGRDTAVAIVVTTLFGLGALLALSPDSPPGIQSLLFGDILGVTTSDLALAAGLALVVVVTLVALHGRLLAVGFDRSSARSVGASAALVDIALLALLGAAILVAVQGLGNLLVVAVLIGPAATARLICRRMAPMMLCGAALAVAGGVGGLYLSYHAGLAAGACVAAVLVGTHLVVSAGVALRRPRRAPRATPAASPAWGPRASS